MSVAGYTELSMTLVVAGHSEEYENVQPPHNAENVQPPHNAVNGQFCFLLWYLAS